LKRHDVSTQADWERVLSAAAFVQQIVPDAIMVGGSAAAIYADHRFSADDDHVLRDLKSRFDVVLGDLQSVAGWKTARLNRPVLILGNLDGVDTGIRNLRRVAPLETTIAEGPWGKITIPTLPEMLRIKTWLMVSRNATRDYLDAVALADKLGPEAAIQGLSTLDALYPQENGASPLQQAAKQFANPHPFDLDDGDLSAYRIIRPPWNKWAYVEERCHALATDLVLSLKSPEQDKAR
jgi:hypothetical protein